MPGVVVDGHDFFAVHEAAGEAVERARAGSGPSLVELKVNRYFGHFEGDAQTYRPDDEVKNLGGRCRGITCGRGRCARALRRQRKRANHLRRGARARYCPGPALASGVPLHARRGWSRVRVGRFARVVVLEQYAARFRR